MTRIVHRVVLCCLVIAFSASSSLAATTKPDRVTFTRDIAPIVFAHCATCHRPDGSATFSLLTYEDVKRHAHDIMITTQRRYMPPWKPEAGFGNFEGVRRLSDDQIGLIQQWIDEGEMEGDPRALPPLPRWTSAWHLGQPDLVLSMERPYILRASGDDMYRHFVLPIQIPATRYIKAWEIRVSNLRVVHHATMEFDPTGSSRLLDEQDPAPGYEGLVSHAVTTPDGFFLDWAPGHSPYVAPDGMAIPIEKGSNLVLMLHLRPSGKPEMVQASVGLYFSKTPPTRIPVLLRLTRQDFVIPAGEAEMVVTSSYKLPVDVDVFTVQPHAHYLAKRIESFATLPDGSKRWMLLIKDWDFNWQDVYRYQTPVYLPAGTTVVMRWTYDNSAHNPVNPNDPPKRVTFGQRTSDEMSELLFQVLPRNPADRVSLTRGIQASIQEQNISGYEMMLQADPGNVGLHNDVAQLYVQNRDWERAAAHLTESMRLQPDSAPAAYNLGTIRLMQHRLGEARRDFEKAVSIDHRYANGYRSLGVVSQAEGKLDEAADDYVEALRLAPDDAITHHDLGVVLQSQGKFDAALIQYREAVRISPDDADAHYGVASILKRQGKASEAILEYREALRFKPDSSILLFNLAWALATAPQIGAQDSAEALRLAERGLKLINSQTASALDVLAAALAASGRFEEAKAAAQKALTLAEAAHEDRAASAIRSRLALYERHQPFRESQ